MTRMHEHGATAGAVAAVERLGAEAGAAILRGGGNAADVAVATCFVQAVVDPWRNSVAGAAQILYHDANSGETIFIDASGYAPNRANDTMFEVESQWENAFSVKNGLNRFGYLAATVPGFVRGIHSLFERFASGRFSWAELLQPAIDFAENGFAVHPSLARVWQRDADTSNPVFGDPYRALSFSDESRRIFLHPDGSVYTTGEILLQPDLARTLKTISVGGPDEFYEGSIADRIVADFAANGGLIDKSDLAGYQPYIEEPLRGKYRGLDVFTQSAPSVGPTILEAIEVLGGWDLASMGWHSQMHLSRLADTLYSVFCDRDENIGDPRVVGNTFRRILSPEHIDEVRSRIEAGEERPSKPAAASEPIHDTTHMTVMDQYGNACGVTHSVGAGTGVITPGLGFMHNCHMTNFDPRPNRVNSIASHKRGTGGGAPVMLFRNGRPILSLGSPAGTFKASAITQAISNRFDFGMSLADAVSVDRIHVRSQPKSVILDDRFDPRSAMLLAALNYPLNYSNYAARVVAVEYNAADGSFKAASDVRGDGGRAVVEGS